MKDKELLIIGGAVVLMLMMSRRKAAAMPPAGAVPMAGGTSNMNSQMWRSVLGESWQALMNNMPRNGAGQVSTGNGVPIESQSLPALIYGGNGSEPRDYGDDLDAFGNVIGLDLGVSDLWAV